MKPSYQKLLQEFTRQRAFNPRDIKFDFSFLGPDPNPEYRDIEFIDRHKLFFSSYSKCLAQSDIARIFERLSRDIAALSPLSEPQNDAYNVKILSYLEKLIACVKDEKMWLHFTAQEKLIELLEHSTNPKVIFLVLKLLFSFLKTKLRVHELFLFNLSEESKIKLLVLVQAWILGVNLCNPNGVINFNEKYQQTDIQAYAGLAFSSKPSFNDEVNFEKLITATNKELKIQPQIKTDLLSLASLTDVEILDHLSQLIGTPVHIRSLNSMFLKIRCTIFCHAFPLDQDGNRVFSDDGHQRVCLMSLVATNIIKSISRSSDLYEKIKITANVFDENVFEKNDELAIDSLETVLPKNFIDPTTFRNTMIFLFNYYIYMNDSSLDLNDRLKEFFTAILERIASETYLQGKSVALNEIDLRVSNFPVTYENIIEILRIVNLFYINESKIRSYHTGDYSSMFDIILSLQAYFNQEIKKNFSEEVMQILLETNRLVMNELEKDKDMILLDIFIDNLKFYLEIYPAYRAKVVPMPGIYDNFLLVLFETIETIDSYFIDPLKSQFLFHIPRVARTILEADFWHSESLMKSMIEDDHFLFIFNELVVLLNDLLNEVAENYLPTFIMKFTQNKFFEVIFLRFGKQCISNEYDSLGFLVNLLSKVHLHNKTFFHEKEIEHVLGYFTSQLITKEALLSNLKRFNTSDSHLALKNFSEELIELCNVHPTLINILMDVIINQIKQIRLINHQLNLKVVQIESEEQLVAMVNNTPLLLKQYGWMKPNSTFEDITDDLMLWQRAVFNYIKFLIKFFDNHKTNVYQNFISTYEKEFGAQSPFLDFVFEDCNISYMFSDYSKYKKTASLMLRTCMITSNQMMIKIFKDYLVQKVPVWQAEISTYTQQCSDSEFAAMTALLHDKNRSQKENLKLHFECFRNPCQRFLKHYTSIAMGLECIRFFVTSTRDTSHINEFFRYFATQQKSILMADQRLVANGGDVFFQMLFDELESQSLEYFFAPNRLNAGQTLQSFYKGLKYLRENSNIETLYELTSRIVRSRAETEERKNLIFPTHFITQFATTIEKITQNPITDTYTLIVLYFHINSLQEFMNLKKTFFDFNTFSNSSTFESMYYLSRVNFFSRSLVGMLKAIINFVAKNQKALKYLLKKRQLDNNVYSKDIIRLFMLDDILAKLIKATCSLIEKFLETKPLTLLIQMRNGSTAKESLIQKIVEAEKLLLISEMTNLLKSLPHETFVVFELEAKIEKDDETIIKKNDKQDKQSNQKLDQKNSEFKSLSLGRVESELSAQQKMIPFKIDKSQSLSAFITEFENLHTFMFKTISEFKLSKEQENNPETTERAKVNFTELGNLSPQEFSERVFDIEIAFFKLDRTKLTEDEILQYKYPNIDVDPPFDTYDKSKYSSLSYFTEQQAKNLDEMMLSNQKNFELIVIYFFNNFLKYKEGHRVLKSLWKCYDVFKKNQSSQQASVIPSMFEAAQQSLKTIMNGVNSKSRVKSEWKLLVKDKDPIFYVLALQVDLLNLMPAKEAKEASRSYGIHKAIEINKNENSRGMSIEHSNSRGPGSGHLNDLQSPTTPMKIPNDTVAYLTGILEEQITLKQRRTHLQEMVKSIFELLAITEKTHDDKFVILKSALTLFKLHEHWLNAKEKAVLINGKILKSLLSLMVIIFYEDEQFLEKLATTPDFKIFKHLLRLKTGKINTALTTQINSFLKTLIETIIRQPHVINLLYESEIKAFLFKQPEKQCELKKMIDTFSRITRNYEKIFAHVFNKTCEVVISAKNTQIVRLAKNQEFTVRSNEIKSYLIDFISILMHDSVFKINQRIQKPDVVYVFNHLVVSEALFFQILPRYPIFYALNLPKDKLTFVVHFFEKALQAHPGYFNFFQPLFFDSPLLVKDQSGAIVSVTKLIRTELINFLLNYVKKLKEKMNGDLSSNTSLNIEQIDGDSKNYPSKLDDIFWCLLNVIMFILQSSKSELFNKEMAQSDLPSSFVGVFEEILSSSINSQKFNSNHLSSLMALPEIIRRRQVIIRMNEEEIKNFEKRAMDMLLLNVPTTFRVSLEKWQNQRQKLSVKDYNISCSSDINYTFFNYERKPDSNNIYRIEEISRPSHGHRHSRDTGSVFRPVFEEDMAERLDEPEFWQDQGLEEQERDSEGVSWQSESNENGIVLGNMLIPPERGSGSLALNWQRIGDPLLNFDLFRNSLRGTNIFGRPPNDGLRNDIMNINLNPMNQNEIPNMNNQPAIQIPPMPQHPDNMLNNQQNTGMDIEGNENNEEEGEDLGESENDEDSLEEENEDEFSDEDDDESDEDDSDNPDEESENSENERLDSEQDIGSSENEDEIMIEIANDMGHNLDEEEDDEEEDEDMSEESEIGFMEEAYDEEFNQSYNEHSESEVLSREYEKQRLERQNADPSYALNITSKIFEGYPYVLPLNLSNTTYFYYNDAIAEEYKDKLSERVLPFIGSRDEQVYRNQQKEFKSFKSDFCPTNNSKIRDKFFTNQLDYHSLDNEGQVIYRRNNNSRETGILNTLQNSRYMVDNIDRVNNDLRRGNTIFHTMDLRFEQLFNDLDRFNSMRRARPGMPEEDSINPFAPRAIPNPPNQPAEARPISLMEEIMKNATVINENPQPNAGESNDNKETIGVIREEMSASQKQDGQVIDNSNPLLSGFAFLKKQNSEIVNEDAGTQTISQLFGRGLPERTESNPVHFETSQISSIPLANDRSNEQNQIISEESSSNQLNQEKMISESTPSKALDEEKFEPISGLEEEKDNEPVHSDSQPQQIPAQNNQPDNTQVQEEQITENKFDFAAYGLPDNFLEIADIDATFFNALPLEIQVETALMIGADLNLINPNAPRNVPNTNENQQNNANANANAQQNQVGEGSIHSHSESESSQQQMMDEQNNNLLFITSLSPELREEVLMTCPDEFLLSLPENIQAEARNLRDNAYLANWAHNQADDQVNIQANTGNLATNRIKKAIKKNKQRDAIKKAFNSSESAQLYPVSPQIIDAIVDMLSDPGFLLKNLPIGYLSSLLFNPKVQEHFYDKIMLLLEGTDQLLQFRALTLLEILCYSNFQYFHIKDNFDRFLRILGEQLISEKLIHKFLKSVNHILKTALSVEEKTESCDIIITPLNLTHLTSVLHSKKSDFSEPLSMILFLLSFSPANLDLIVSNLQENIDKFAFNLSFKLVEIMDDQTKCDDNEDSLMMIGKKITATYDAQVRLLKIFKLLEQLFKRSFSQIYKQAETGNNNGSQEKTDQFDKIKQKVLASFSNYFNQKNIRRVFINLFKVLRFYESKIDKVVSKRQVSKPAFLKLLPLVESFFTIYKLLCDDDFLKSIKQNLRLVDNATGPADIRAAEYVEQLSEASDVDLLSQTSKQSDSKMKSTLQSGNKKESSDITIQTIFNNACKYNKSILNYLLSQTSKVSQSPLSVLIRHASRIVNFDIKRKYFAQSLQMSKSTYMLRLVVRRSHLFQDSYTQVSNKSGTQMRGKLHIRFQDEEGEDAGGVQREWFNSLSHEIFNPDYALFIPASHGYAYQPSAFSHVNTEHLSYFKFVGKIVGKALFDGQLLDVHFTRSFYKHMTGTPLNYLDFEDYDPDYFRTLKWILENDVDDLDMDFSYQQDIFGKKEIKELKPNGRNIAVTNENKAEYIRLICEVKMTEEIRPQIQAFLEGLHSVIPHELMKIFDPKELELMISGLPEIDLADLRENTEYVNYTKDSLIIRNFWEVLQAFDENLKAGFLQFVTGTSKVPFEGFQYLKGIGGAVQKFNIHKAYDTQKLPTSHTCMNQLDLPDYQTKEELEEKLKKAILYGREGFGFV